MNSRFAIEAMEEERRRLARDIHDGPAQMLTNLTMRLEVVKEMLRHQPDHVLPEILRIQELMRNSVGELRRLIYDLRPVEMAEVGLAGALRAYGERCVNLLERNVTVDVDGLPALSEDASITLYRMVQECITNAGKHAQAQTIAIRVERVESELILTIADDGIGMSPGTATGRYGLLGLQERARLIGADVAIDTAPGKGTTVRIQLKV
ncbi:sensor histidine kinase [Ferroacidibacillus organovorans]|uniref:histidine kinase n=1 Tax=Ferroacidibacillus organovorans TaxID=1765683 RepID=A0A117SYB9_9BACL|nr:sensor histidine kinase [Ferroacidibacillus organovorans]KUO96711.1 hypothetical protein ATW55_07760 [Ferroacidibacillus organovorans]